VVDDHHDGAETLGDFLGALGCDVRLAHSGAEALEAAPTFQPQLVILDIEMPGMSGLETAQRLRAQPWAKRSIFATHSGSINPAIADLSTQSGCQHHIPKPAPVTVFEKLVDVVRSQLDAPAGTSFDKHPAG
jgi:CheY-like chemotaxis protein